jgi:multidrug efflux pump subunit AcrA (membrane-fusion protein)
VSDSAISTLAGVSSVYIVKDGKITQKAVTLGVRQGDKWEIIDGLKGDEILASSRLNELATGVSIEIDKGSPGGGEGGKSGKGGGKSGKGKGKRAGGPQ